jgi:hypothetical protein
VVRTGGDRLDNVSLLNSISFDDSKIIFSLPLKDARTVSVFLVMELNGQRKSGKKMLL